MKILLLGDIHANWNSLNRAIAIALREHSDITHIINVGDNGEKFFQDAIFTPMYELRKRKIWPIYFCDGNHDRVPYFIENDGTGNPFMKWMPRGSILQIEGKRILFFGGATSIDRQHRTEGKDWWPTETIKYAEVIKTLNEVDGPIDCVISHDRPENFPAKKYEYKEVAGQGDRQALQALWEKYYPEYWFYGHYHAPDHGFYENTEFVCCPIIDSLNYVIWDGEKVTMSWQK